MSKDGILDAEAAATGQWRWTYVTRGGAMYLGPKLYTTKTAAKKAGRAWLQEQPA